MNSRTVKIFCTDTGTASTVSWFSVGDEMYGITNGRLLDSDGCPLAVRSEHVSAVEFAEMMRQAAS